MTTPDQIVDKRQRLVGLLDEQLEHWDETLDGHPAMLTGNGKCLTMGDLRAIRNALASPSEGNKKGDEGRDAPGTASAPEKRDDLAPDGTTALGKDGPATPSRPQEQPRKDGYTVGVTGGGFYSVLDPQGNSVGTFISRDHADEYARRCSARAASVPPAAAEGWQMPTLSRPDVDGMCWLHISGGKLHASLAVRTGTIAERAIRAWLAAAPPSPAAQEQEKQDRLLQFAQMILHGDDEHRAWLTEAAVAFVAGHPLPAPRSGAPS